MKDRYRQLCEQRDDIPLFQQAWWLDASAGDHWDVVVLEKGGQIAAALPFVRQRRYGLTLLGQPSLAPWLGPWLAPSPASRPRKLARTKSLMQGLIDRLPPHHVYHQKWAPQYQYWLPFYWRGFTQTTRYTYQLNGISDDGATWKAFQQNIRREIRKARNRFQITVRPACDLTEFLALNIMTFERQGLSLPYSNALVSRIEEAAAARNARDCLIAVDSQGKSHAGAYIVRQGNTAYYLLGGANPALRGSGASSLVIWEAIRRQPDGVEIFDFEGSMIESVERFFRAFGAKQTPYFSVSRASSRMVKAAIYLRELIRGT